MAGRRRNRDVGVVGVGQMGRGIARRLDQAGHLRAVHDVSPEAVRSAGLSEAVTAGTLGDLGRSCAIILLVVPTSREIDTCLRGADGLLATAGAGTVLVDLTTSDPLDTGRLAAAAEAAGMRYLDCGMSGGGSGADAGTLTLMIGGDGDILRQFPQVFDAIAERIFHVGPRGAGHTMKLIHNMVCHTIFLATCEGARTAEAAGISLETAIAVFNAGNARSYVSEERFPNHIVNGAWNGRSRVANLEKDLRMAVALANRLGRQAEFARQTRDLLAKAMAAGYGDDDFTTLYERFDALTRTDPA